jgi:hypothetical protein
VTVFVSTLLSLFRTGEASSMTFSTGDKFELLAEFAELAKVRTNKQHSKN